MNIIGRCIRYIIRVKKHEILSKIIKENNFKTYVEVGVWKGKTLFKIAKRNKHMIIHGIDDYDFGNYEGYILGEPMATSNIKTYAKIKDDVIRKSLDFENVSIIIERSLSAVKRFEDNSLDIVFIDALHNYKGVSEDITAWLPKVRKGGVLCGHDFNLNHFSIVKAVGDLIGYDNIRVNRYASIWVHRK